MRLAEGVLDRGNVSDAERDGVKVVCIVGERLYGQFLGVRFNKCDLWRWNDPLSARKKRQNTRACVRTTMVHRLLETIEARLQHLSVDIDDVDARLPVRVRLARVVEDAQRDVARPTGDVDATYGPPRARTQERDEGVLPKAVHSERHGVVHDVVLGRDRVEHAAHERLFRFFWDGAEAKVRCAAGAGGSCIGRILVRGGRWVAVRVQAANASEWTDAGCSRQRLGCAKSSWNGLHS